jgi:putative transposase
LLHEAAKRYNFELLDCEVDVDHVHVVVSLPLTMRPTVAVNYLKGYTAKCLFKQFPRLRKYYKKAHLWSPGKFMGSVGHITLEKANQYLEAHHAKKAINGIPAFSRSEKVARKAIL